MSASLRRSRWRRLMTRFSARHPEIQFSRLVIAQVPGSMPRSTTVHGVVESFFKSKKYIVPSAVVSPIFAGCVAAVYVGTGAGHFEPARNAMVFVVGSDPEPPHGPRRSPRLSGTAETFAGWGVSGRLGSQSPDKAVGTSAVQSEGTTSTIRARPVLRVQVGDNLVRSRRLRRQHLERQRIASTRAPVVGGAPAVGVAPHAAIGTVGKRDRARLEAAAADDIAANRG